MKKRLYEYSIISGRVVETKRSLLPSGPAAIQKYRRAKVAGASSEAKIKRNEHEAGKQLARIINCNYGPGDLYLTLKYDANHLPSDYDRHRKIAAAFIRALRAEAVKNNKSEKFKYIIVSANWSPKENAPARLHHHMVIKGVELNIIEKIWSKYGTVYISHLDSGIDYSDLAAYLIANVKAEKASQRRYTCSRGLEKPIYTEPVEVFEPEGIVTEPEASIIVRYSIINYEGNVIGSYIRYTLQYAPKVRGGLVQLKSEYFSWQPDVSGF